MNMQVSAGVQQGWTEAKVIRCGCGHPETHLGEVCPTPRTIEDRGAVAYFHRNPLRLWAWAINRKIKEFRNRKLWTSSN